MPGRAPSRTTQPDPRSLLVALMRADRADPVHQPSLTRDDIVVATAAAGNPRTRSQVDYAIERKRLKGVPGLRNGHSCSLFAPAVVARWISNPLGDAED